MKGQTTYGDYLERRISGREKGPILSEPEWTALGELLTSPMPPRPEFRQELGTDAPLGHDDSKTEETAS